MKKLKTKLSELIINNWKSSIIGVLLIALATVILFTSRATFSEVSILYIVGVGFLGAKDNWLNTSNFKILIVGLVLFSSCITPQQKFNKLISKYPYLIENKIDTIKDTIVINKFDTIVNKGLEQFLNGDTIFIYKDKIEVQTFYKDNFVYTSIKQKQDTIFRTIYQEKYIVKKQDITLEDALNYIWKKYWFPIILICLFILLALFIKYK